MKITLWKVSRIRTFVSVVLLTVALTACSGDEVSFTVPSGAQAGDLVGLEPCTYETGDVEFSAGCGTLVVPENRSDPNSRLIALPIKRIQATGVDSAEPIFWLTGGPGQSNMRFSHPQDLTALLANHDFVLVGYRGADGSVVLDCPEISKAINDSPGNLLGETGLGGYSAAAAQCSDRLQTQGVDLAGYTMTETIDDMEAARKALRYKQVNLLGISYGTRLEIIYEWMYPESLNHVVMLNINTPGHFVWEAETIDAQIADYARLCAEDLDCRTRTADLAGTMGEVASNMPNRWRLMPIDEDKVNLITFIMFFESMQQPGSPVPLSGPAAVDMWAAAADGDFSGMALSSMLTKRFIPDLFTWGHLLSMGGGTGEYSDPNRDYLAEFDPPGSIIGSPLSILFWSVSTGWPVYPNPDEYNRLQSSNVETLLVAGSVDFSTPPEAAKELIPYLSNGDLVLLEEFGHADTFWNSQPEARLHMLTHYFKTGQVDASLYRYQPVDFDMRLGWPRLAKIVMTVSLLLVVAVGALVLWFVRRRRRRMPRESVVLS